MLKKQSISPLGILAYLPLFMLAVICILPFYIMIINSTHANSDIARGVNLLPGTNFFTNYKNMSVSVSIFRSLRNSVFVAVSSTLLTGYFGTMAAYGFAMYKFRGSGVLFWVVLSTMMIPFQLSLLGIYRMASILHLLNSYWPIIFPAIANAGTVFWMRSHIESVIDLSYVEAARVDGYSELGIFHTIILPLSRMGIITISILNFVHVWNDYMTPVMMLSDMKLFTVPVSIAILKSAEAMDQGAVYCGVALSIVPIIIIYLVLNSQITSGITTGGIKG